ncbi:hypothetical protein IKE82_00745, partial [Candidatus Saccharibacteria bacterium]|nr:hypothetical protein [Candidatus Saccharibacteria bacterium]
MKQNVNQSNQLNHILYSTLSVTLSITVLSVFTMPLLSAHAATGTASDSKTSQASVTVSATCSMTANIAAGDEHTATLPNGVWSGGSDYYPNGIGKTTIQTFCNDASGYSIYAVGYTGDTT